MVEEFVGISKKNKIEDLEESKYRHDVADAS